MEQGERNGGESSAQASLPDEDEVNLHHHAVFDRFRACVGIGSIERVGRLHSSFARQNVLAGEITRKHTRHVVSICGALGNEYFVGSKQPVNLKNCFFTKARQI